MSLNRYEQALFDYWNTHPEERLHWHFKVTLAARDPADPGVLARGLERELWEYFAERRDHVTLLRNLDTHGLRRISLLNLAEHLLRLWGPPPKPKAEPAGPRP